MSTPSSERQRQIFVLFLLALVTAGKVIQPCLDWDTWWHLRVGQYIVQNNTFPASDPFSQIGQQEHVPWVAYSWLYELLLYGSFQAAGASGVLALRYLLVMLSWGGIAWFLLRHAPSGWLALGLLALISISLRPFSPERPWHFTILFTTLTLHAVIETRNGAPWRRYWWLAICYVLWANIHIQFVMGFAILGLGWLATLGERRFADAWQVFRLGAICSLATLVTPFHYRLYIVIWEYASQTQALQLVMELHPPNWTAWYNWPMIALGVTAIVCVIKRRFPLWDVLLLACGLFFALRMQRDLWFGVLTASAVIINRRGDAGEWRIGLKPLAGVALAAIALVSFAWEAGLSQGKTVTIAHAETYPVRAVEIIRERKLPGPMFNNFDWGGYLIWELPEYPVSIDGRTNLYGEARLVRSIDTWSGDPGWEKNPEMNAAGFVIAPKPTDWVEFGKLLDEHPDDWRDRRANRTAKDLGELLRRHPGWRIEYEDDTAIIFVPVTGR